MGGSAYTVMMGLRVVVEALIVSRYGTLALAIRKPYSTVLKPYAGRSVLVSVNGIAWKGLLRLEPGRHALYIIVPRKHHRVLEALLGAQTEAVIEMWGVNQ